MLGISLNQTDQTGVTQNATQEREPPLNTQFLNQRFESRAALRIVGLSLTSCLYVQSIFGAFCLESNLAKPGGDRPAISLVLTPLVCIPVR